MSRRRVSTGRIRYAYESWSRYKEPGSFLGWSSWDALSRAYTTLILSRLSDLVNEDDETKMEAVGYIFRDFTKDLHDSMSGKLRRRTNVREDIKSLMEEDAEVARNKLMEDLNKKSKKEKKDNKGVATICNYCDGRSYKTKREMKYLENRKRKYKPSKIFFTDREYNKK